MTQTVAVRDAILAELIAEPTLSGVRTVEYHGGSVNEEQLERYGPHAPALLLTWLGAPASRFLNTASQAFTSWALFVVTRQRSRHTDALNLHDLVVQHLLQGTIWGGAACARPENVASENLYSARFDKAGLEVIVIRWDQWVEFAEDDGSSLPDFELLDVCYYPAATRDADGFWGDEWAMFWADTCIAEDLVCVFGSGGFWSDEWAMAWGSKCAPEDPAALCPIEGDSAWPMQWAGLWGFECDNLDPV